MRILKQEISGKDQSGRLKVQAEEAEDMYHLYNIISIGDAIESSTVRNYTREGSTGSTTKSRVHTTLTIATEKVEFDAERCSLRIAGKNIVENEFVKLGQYHTIDIEISQPFSITKDCWDQIYLDRVNQAVDPSKSAEVAAVVMHEGLCHLCLLTSAMTVTRSRIERRMPKKKLGDKLYSKARANFFEDIYDAIKTHVNFTLVKAILVGSPGFLKDDFMAFLLEVAERRGDTEFLRNKSKFIKTHASSGHKKSIEEMLADPALRGQLGDVKAANEVRALEQFYQVLTSDPDRACYGYDSVASVDALVAVDCLLVTDKLFKSADVKMRRAYVDLVDSVKSHGGTVFIFSSLHVSGEQLDKFTGVAATLRFPCPETAELLADVTAVDDSSESDTSSDSSGDTSDEEIDETDPFSSLTVFRIGGGEGLSSKTTTADDKSELQSAIDRMGL